MWLSNIQTIGDLNRTKRQRKGEAGRSIFSCLWTVVLQVLGLPDSDWITPLAFLVLSFADRRLWDLSASKFLWINCHKKKKSLLAYLHIYIYTYLVSSDFLKILTNISDKLEIFLLRYLVSFEFALKVGELGWCFWKAVVSSLTVLGKQRLTRRMGLKAKYTNSELILEIYRSFTWLPLLILASVRGWNSGLTLAREWYRRQRNQQRSWHFCGNLSDKTELEGLQAHSMFLPQGICQILKLCGMGI